ncbi:MAG: DUF3631 domain-containing protein [Deltaproteobacteria bacterium]|nr:DUF3631 domain-containing protein [Deltaproteobacteria bacterium]
MTLNTDINVCFTPNKAGDSKGQLNIRNSETLLHSDILNIAKNKERESFIRKTCQLYPAIDAEQLRQKILELVPDPQDTDKVVDDSKKELDIDNIVRPHLFHTPLVSGMLVPVTSIDPNGQLTGDWQLHLQWKDGKRQIVPVTNCLDDHGHTLWFDGIPGQPKPNTVSLWSRQSRQQWLDGYSPDMSQIFTELCDLFAWFLKFRDEDTLGTIATLSLWTLLTYVYPIWDAVPYLSIGGPLGSGKSRVFDVLSQVVFRPLPSANMTAPCLFRTLHEEGWTLLLDEAERLNERTPEANEIRSILLSGYKKHSRAHRLEKTKDSFQTNAYDVYSPKSIAGIAGLPPALASRCIRIVMLRSPKDSPINRRRIPEKADVFAKIRDDLHAMALSHSAQIIKYSGYKPDCQDFNGRDYEIWQPLLALADMLEQGQDGIAGLVQLVQEHAIKTMENNEDIMPETDEILLQLLREEIYTDFYGIEPGKLLEKAKEKEPALFSKYSARGISSILSRYNIKSQKTNGKRVFRPSKQELGTVFEAYGIEPESSICSDSQEETSLCT